VYEPLGIVNLEAMACATAVVASDVGGIPEVVADGVTGSLVHYEPGDPAGYQARLAEAVNALVADPERRSATAKRDGSAALRSSPGHASRSRRWRFTGRCACNAGRHRRLVRRV
jgi:glycosyltransferase involved in cell wall biosynthesis